MTAMLPAFSFEALLASHAYGAVYAARQISLDRQVAIKLLSPHASSNPEFQGTFRDHARAMACLNHPNLISVFDSGMVNGMLYSVSEFVPGKSLSRSMAGKPIEWELSLRIVHDIATGLSHAHRNDIIHGRLSADDILLTPKIEPKIGNFGFSGPLSGTGAPVPPSVSPEVTAGSPADPRSDVFSLGAIFYQLVTGQPHGPEQPSPSALVSCPDAADEFWKKATHPRAGLRFQSIAEMQGALKSMMTAGSQPAKTAEANAAGGAKLQTNDTAKRIATPITPAAGAPVVPPAATPPEPVGFNWTLLRNLVIIVGLLYAISLAWENYNANQARTVELQRQANEKHHTAPQEVPDEGKVRDASQSASRGNGSVTEAVTGENAGESPDQSLARLKPSLAAGKRTEYPKGAVAQGNSHYFLVKTPMGWAEAADFAEQHGAHIAIPSVEANLQWISATFFTDPGLWLGAARSGQNAWTLADATRWKPAKEPLGTGHFLAVDKAGVLRAASTRSKLPFVIQWRNDGSNPGTLAKWLDATRSTLASPDAVFPPGTRHYQNRHFLRVARECTWDEALAMAARSGGCLAAPSSASEATALEDLTRELDSSEVLWLGGKSTGSEWSWVSGEPWKFTRWSSQATSNQADSALVLRPGSGWEARKPSRSAKGFIIEWSRDPNSR